MSTPQRITPALFVQLWMESHAAGHTMRQFADRIGMKTSQTYARAFHYRKRGVQLPALARSEYRTKGKSKLDVVALNAIVAVTVQARGRNGRAHAAVRA
jgi:hypothetical protein